MEVSGFVSIRPEEISEGIDLVKMRPFRVLEVLFFGKG